MSKGATTKVISAIAALTFSVACAGEDPMKSGGAAGNSRVLSESEGAQHQADLDFGLVAELVVAEGHVIKFMEPSPGALAISETFNLDNRRPLNLGQPIDAIWRKSQRAKRCPKHSRDWPIPSAWSSRRE